MSDSDTIWMHSHVAASDGHPYRNGLRRVEVRS